MSNREDWPWWVARKYAEKDGRRPDEFDHWRWPVSNVSLALRGHEGPSTAGALTVRCEIPASTPQANQYERDERYKSGDERGWRKLPDPVGLALSRVRVELRAVDDDEVLISANVGHRDGVCGGWVGHAGDKLFARLTPGTSLQVRLYALPLFYWLSEDGSAMAAYANMGHRGYFAGDECESRAHLLTLTEGMTPDDPTPTLLLDGEPAPPAPEVPPAVLTPEEIELQAQEERERAEYERERRENAERARRQREEIEAAKKLIYGRRDDYGSVEDWLFGVLHDKAVDFAIRKRIYLVADEVGFDLVAAKQRRIADREREAAEKKRRHEEQQTRQRIKDDIELIEGMFDTYGASTADQKAALLRRAYAHPRFAKYKPAIEHVAGELGVTL